MTNATSIECLRRETLARACLIANYCQLINDQLNGDIDIVNGKTQWQELLSKHVDDKDALAEALTWTLNKRLVIAKDKLIQPVRKQLCQQDLPERIPYKGLEK
ncbi:hypothetical protein [Caedibacter taeniospiralis]|jgi:hypothetical protein|uniref:hypothetical protein n=1 Tax=Caedibacter taeniospiralis TaxID=28907 RepID=UPI0037C0F489